MPIKDKRIEIRVDAESVDHIVRAAELVREPVSVFIRRAADERAGQVLAREQITVMAADQFDVLMASLDVADEASALAAVASEPRRFASR